MTAPFPVETDAARAGATVGDRGAVGVIGCGNVTRSTLSDFVAAGGSVAWVVDPDAGARASVVEEVARLQGTAPMDFRDVDEALRRGESSAPVMINSPGILHEKHIQQSARAGRPVLVAKPMGMDWAESERALNLADAAGVSIDVAEQYPDEPHAVHIRTLLDQHGPARRILLDHRKPASGQTTLAGKHQTGILEYAVHHYALLASWLDEPPAAIAVDLWTGNGGRSGEGSIGHAWIHFDSCHVLHAFGFGGERATYRAEIETDDAVILADGSHFASPDVDVALLVGGISAPVPAPPGAGSAWGRLFERWLSSPADHTPEETRRRIRAVTAMTDAALRAADSGVVIDLRSDARYRNVW